MEDCTDCPCSGGVPGHSYQLACIFFGIWWVHEILSIWHKLFSAGNENKDNFHYQLRTVCVVWISLNNTTSGHILHWNKKGHKLRCHFLKGFYPLSSSKNSTLYGPLLSTWTASSRARHEATWSSLVVWWVPEQAQLLYFQCPYLCITSSTCTSFGHFKTEWELSKPEVVMPTMRSSKVAGQFQAI